MGHGDHHHDDHHDDHHHEQAYVPYKGQRVVKPVRPIPAMGSREYEEMPPVFNEEKMANDVPATNSERLLTMLTMRTKSERESASINSSKNIGETKIGFFDRIFHAMMYPLPRTYTSAYMRPNPCPEVHWWNSWRWPKFRNNNPKVEPPVDGAFNDYYHYLAFRNWFENERAVYYQNNQIHHEIVLRCLAKEGQYNGWKNCKHLLNKEFALTREAEHNQVLLHMAVTGENAIRDTPYPEDHVEQKRKMYDNWLFRTRMRKAGDVL